MKKFILNIIKWLIKKLANIEVINKKQWTNLFDKLDKNKDNSINVDELIDGFIEKITKE